MKTKVEGSFSKYRSSEQIKVFTWIASTQLFWRTPLWILRSLHMFDRVCFPFLHNGYCRSEHFPVNAVPSSALRWHSRTARTHLDQYVPEQSLQLARPYVIIDNIYVCSTCKYIQYMGYPFIFLPAHARMANFTRKQKIQRSLDRPATFAIR